MAGWVPETWRFESFYSPDIAGKECLYVINPKNEPDPRRCRNWLDGSKIKLAKAQRQDILNARVVNIPLIEAYIQSLCCTRPGAEHHHRIEDSGCMQKLAERWQREIKDARKKEDKAQQQRHSSRSESTATTSSRALRSSRAPAEPVRRVPEFRPLKANPEPSECVAHKILDPIGTYEHEKPSGSHGIVYGFTRERSPGFVKIGFTGKSDLRRRVDDWAKCGYTPKVVFRIDSVLHPRRVELLTHYELVREWRKESWCENCKGPHVEWFEVSSSKAERVVTSWAEFITEAEPYDEDGYIKYKWERVIDKLVKNGEDVTGKTLLKVHHARELAKSQKREAERERISAKERSAARVTSNTSRSQLTPGLDPKVKMESKSPVYSTTIPIRSIQEIEILAAPEKERRGLRRKLKSILTGR